MLTPRNLQVKFLKTAALALLLLVRVTLLSAEEHVMTSEEEWFPPSAGPITTWTAPLCEAGRLLIQPFFFYNYIRGTYDDSGHYSSLPTGTSKEQYQEFYYFQYGITDRFEVDGQAVYQQFYAKEDDRKSSSSGWGDTYLWLRYCTVDEQAVVPQITLISQLKFPTGKYEKLDPDKLGTDSMGAVSGGGSFDHGYGFVLTKRFEPFIFHADIVYSFPGGVTVDEVKTAYADYLQYDASVEYFLPHGFNLMFEFNWFTQADKKEDGQRIPGTAVKYLTMCPGIGWSNDTIQLLLAYQRAISGTNVEANDSVVATLVYTF